MARTKERLYLGVGSHAVALDAATGQELWRTKLKTTSFVTLTLSGQRLFAGASGEVFCLDADTGDLLWHNKLKALGMGLVAFGARADVASSAAIMATQAAASAAAVIAATS